MRENYMKISQLHLLAAVSLAAFATPAFAQSEDEQWEGAYIGGTIGIPAQKNDGGESVLFDTDRDGQFNDTVRTTTGANAFSPGFCGGAANGRTPAEGCRSDKDGIEYNVRAGYDMQKGNIVYGVVLEGGTSDARDSVTAFSTTPAFYTFTREIDYTLGARLRVGYAARGALFYATGGGAYAKIKNSFVTSNTANSFANNGNTKSLGYAAGGGAEVKVTKKISLGLEYLYTNYSEDKYRVNVGPGTAPATNPFLLVSGGTDFRRSDRDFDMHNIRVTAAYRF
jgi:outer membrane immunogenic protein